MYDFFLNAVYLISKSYTKFIILVLVRNVCENGATDFAYRKIEVDNHIDLYEKEILRKPSTKHFYEKKKKKKIVE